VDALFVRPAWRRRGLAGALVGRAVNALLAEGERLLYSGYRLGNEPSRLWHVRFGFEELPDVGVAGHRAAVYDAEWRRQRRLGGLGARELEELERLAACWHNEWLRLQSAAEGERGRGS
jgi:hypothetical protein